MHVLLSLCVLPNCDSVEQIQGKVCLDRTDTFFNYWNLKSKSEELFWVMGLDFTSWKPLASTGAQKLNAHAVPLVPNTVNTLHTCFLFVFFYYSFTFKNRWWFRFCSSAVDVSLFSSLQTQRPTHTKYKGKHKCYTFCRGKWTILSPRVYHHCCWFIPNMDTIKVLFTCPTIEKDSSGEPAISYRNTTEPQTPTAAFKSIRSSSEGERWMQNFDYFLRHYRMHIQITIFFHGPPTADMNVIYVNICVSRDKKHRQRE